MLHERCSSKPLAHLLPSPSLLPFQWLERAREALKREVGDIQQQHVQLAAGLNSAVAVAAAAPASPQKQLAAQVGEKRWWAAGWLVGETRSPMQPLHFFGG